jgi:hypothetical protein
MVAAFKAFSKASDAALAANMAFSTLFTLAGDADDSAKLVVSRSQVAPCAFSGAT